MVGVDHSAMTEETTRLHITPLTPDILPSVLPASLRSSATDTSFHSIPTFPENSYGYITLPTAEAEKIRKKLNGSILKGKKFKVEMARPQKRQRDEEDAAVAESVDGKKKEKKSKKRKSEDKVLDGYELPSDRKVKRGWTEPSNAKKEKRKSEKKGKDDKKAKPQPKSKYTEKPECLFRTEVPPNRKSAETVDDKKAKKKKKSSRESVVHEFEKTIAHPSFLRSKEDGAAPTATFEEGKGWVDATGNVKEPVSEKIRKDNFHPGQVPGPKEKRPGKKSSSKEIVKSPDPSSESEDWTSSSGSSSDESSDTESESSGSPHDESDSSVDEVASVQPALSKEASGSINDSAAPSDDSDPEMANEGAPHTSESSKEVHPLEALFKRPAPEAAEEQPAPDNNAGFSFFGNDDIESEDEAQSTGPQTPFTPFTKRDLQTRGLRSAAPTPDTAMVNRRMNWDDVDEADEDVSIDTPAKSRGTEDTPQEETGFAKWFWEHRGENNRAWKKRRRDAAKEQRQRDNRKKGLKGKS